MNFKYCLRHQIYFSKIVTDLFWFLRDKIDCGFTYHFGVFVLLGTLDELLLLAPIDEGRKSGNDEYSQVNGSSIKPS